MYKPPHHSWHGEQIKAMRTKSEAELRYLIKDCQEVIKLQHTFNPKCGEYQDQIHYAVMELSKRAKAKAKKSAA